MDIDKVRGLTDTELLTELVSQRRNLYDLRFQLATRQLTDHSQLSGTRRSIARILTVLTERGVDESTVLLPTPVPAARSRRAASPATKTAAAKTAAGKTAATKTAASKTAASGRGDK